MILGRKIKAISLPQKCFHTTYLEQTATYSAIVFLPLHPPGASPSLAPPFILTLLHNRFCTTLNHFVFRFQRDAGGDGLQRYENKANKTRLNLSVEVLWLEGIAGITVWATAPNVVDITPLFTSPLCLKIP